MPRYSRQVPISSQNTRAARNAHARATQQFITYDTSAIRPKKSKAPLIISLLVIVVALAVIIFVLMRGCSYEGEILPYTQEAIVVVEEGQGAKKIAETLKQEKLISNTQSFVDLVTENDATSSLIPGTYLFQGGTSQEEILRCLLAGPISTADVITIPEGFTRQNIADAIDEGTHSRITAEDFLAATENASEYADTYEFLKSAGEKSLEGYLFPKTYTITATDKAENIAFMMLDQFQEETDNLKLKYPRSQGLSFYDMVNLASIVQKEGIPENYAEVASVFYNRLSSDRPYLDSDATTAYEVGHDPTPEEVHSSSEYSTYTHQGLPPTPICNPGIEAMKAACNPDKTNYMYFYAYGNGEYVFNETYDGHMDAINKEK